MKKGLDTILMLGYLASMDFENKRGAREHEIPEIYNHDKPPTGSKQYWFDSKGNFSTERILNKRLTGCTG